MVVPRLIERKRDGGALTGDEWRALVAGYTAGQVPDYQMAALAMAIYFRGLQPDELAALTDAMLDSGDRLRFDGETRPRIDKHSTGGVGDKTSLLLAPMLAACRRAGANDVGAWAGPHWWNARQARSDTRLPDRPAAGTGHRPGAFSRGRDDRTDRRDRPGRSAGSMRCAM